MSERALKCVDHAPDRTFRMFWRTFLFFALTTVSAVAQAPQQLPYFEELRAGNTVYRRVQVRQVTATSLVVLHAGGLGQIPLSSLSPDLQKYFNYDPRKAEELASQARQQAAARLAQDQRLIRRDSAERAMERFGQPAAPRADGVDLRPRFKQLDIAAKNQGRRPSCAVFAIIGALEYQNAELIGRTERLSEEYLVWATLRSIGRTAAAQDTTSSDAGFSLVEVAQALRAYGVALQTQMPYAAPGAPTPEPPQNLVEDARQRRNVVPTFITGRDPESRLANVIHALNEGLPVIAGVMWPRESTLAERPVLDAQTARADYAHAITLVGYRNPTGKIQDLVFYFRNSYGRNWGYDGYGEASYAYLLKNMHAALFLEPKR